MEKGLDINCESCDAAFPRHDIISYGSMDQGYRQLCSLCFNAEVAKLHGVKNFDNVRLSPIGITDCIGESHQFHFTIRLLGSMVTLDAFELQDGQIGGYQFQLIGSPEDDSFYLLGRMVGRIRKALSVKYIADNSDGHGLQIVDKTVQGHIECEYSQDIYMPIVVVDGQEISWDEFGRMVSTFEGWQFKLEMIDRSDEL